ncbi:MAG: hypothetical protein ACRD3J_04370 [Thermoanaerobaculia bacterium]
MRRIFLCLTLAVFTACESTTDPFGGIIEGGGGAITAAQASGNWTFTVQRTTTFPCTAALTSGQSIATNIAVLSDGSLSTTSSWANPVSSGVEALDGVVSLSNGLVDFMLSVNTSTAMELTGTMSSAGTFSVGTLRDPAPGSFQVFGSDGCQYTATGVKTS